LAAELRREYIRAHSAPNEYFGGMRYPL